MTSAQTTPKDRLCQGDIIRYVQCVESVRESGGVLEICRVQFPIIIVLTQDCDLSQDHRLRCADKVLGSEKDQLLVSVLVAPLYNAEHVFDGEHLSCLDISAQRFKRGKTDHRQLITNQKPRYHYIEFPENVQVVPSVIDFKHYFSVHVDYLYALSRTNFVCSVAPLYREQISHRFAFFLSRIGLPIDADPRGDSTPVLNMQGIGTI